MLAGSLLLRAAVTERALMWMPSLMSSAADVRVIMFIRRSTSSTERAHRRPDLLRREQGKHVWGTSLKNYLPTDW